MTNLNHSSQKQSYHLPQFRAYGNISRLTQQNNNTPTAKCDKSAVSPNGCTSAPVNKTS
jgi:hypothetical protein